MPPAFRNHLVPTAGDTPASTAASSLERPAAINTQNWCRSSRRATEGRPGDGNAPRPDRSERRFRTAIATSSLKVLRRPVEPGLVAGLGQVDHVAGPTHAGLGPEAGVGVVRRLDAVAGATALHRPQPHPVPGLIVVWPRLLPL